MEQKTVLHACHEAAGGKLVPYAGYLMPVQYAAGIIAEHQAVREKAGLFDISHMGEFFLSGEDALKNLNSLLTNDFSNLSDGQARYSPMCNEDGGVVDDLIVYRFDEGRYLLVVNASNREKDAQWIRAHLSGAARMEDRSEEYAALALQGPLSEEILRRVAQEGSLPERYYHFKEGVAAGAPCLISRTGYTGEHGYELYFLKEHAVTLWNALMEAGEPLGLLPCGLGARDTLRLEAAMPLYGHEMNDEISPLETGLSFAVKMDKPEFIGRKALLDRGESRRCRVGLKVVGRGIVREEAPLFSGGRQVGVTTSGTHLPYLGYAGAMALVEQPFHALGTELVAQVRGREIPVQVAALPFYKRTAK